MTDETPPERPPEADIFLPFTKEVFDLLVGSINYLTAQLDEVARIQMELDARIVILEKKLNASPKEG